MKNTTTTETRTCTQYHANAGAMCGREFVATLEGLDSGSRVCGPCAELASATWSLTARGRYGETWHVCNGQIRRGGEVPSYLGSTADVYASIRRWVEIARRDGATKVRLEIARHTRTHGWKTRRVSL